MLIEIFIYAIVFIIGFFVGRIATAIQYGLKFDQMAHKLRKQYKRKSPKHTAHKK